MIQSDSEHQFLYHLCEVYGKLPDDDFFENIDPYMKLWLYESWLHKQKANAKMMKNQAILTGSFFNPEAANKILKSENPDVKVSEEEFDQTSAKVREEIIKQDTPRKKKKRKKRKAI